MSPSAQALFEQCRTHLYTASPALNDWLSLQEALMGFSPSDHRIALDVVQEGLMRRRGLWEPLARYCLGEWLCDQLNHPGESLLNSFDLKPKDCFVIPPCNLDVPGHFAIGACPVTQAQYQAVTGLTPSHFNGANTSGVTGEHPVEQVHWYEALAFCNLSSIRDGLAPYYTGPDQTPYSQEQAQQEIAPEIMDLRGTGWRLPTEAEWAYACRAGTEGDTYGPLDEIAWYKGNSEGHTHPVGLKEPNAWGLYDTLGNVGEWCSDTEPNGSDRVILGGSWSFDAEFCRADMPDGGPPGTRFLTLGFRLVRSI